MILQYNQDDDDEVEGLSEDDFLRAESMVEEDAGYNSSRNYTITCSATRYKTIDGEDDDFFLVHSRSAVPENERWPKNQDGKVYIPYVFGGVGFNANQRRDIAKAMQIYSERTCIRFRPKQSGDRAYITLKGVGNQGCIGFSPVGYHKVHVESGQHILQLPGNGVNGCPESIVGLYFHEFMHTVGFEHEHERSDRDRYVIINYNKIQPQFKYAFDITKNRRLIGNYDYLSIMHYASSLFAIRPGDVTIQARDARFQDKMGRNQGSLGPVNGGVNQLDIQKINYLYQCSGYPSLG